MSSATAPKQPAFVDMKQPWKTQSRKHLDRSRMTKLSRRISTLDQARIASKVCDAQRSASGAVHPAAQSSEAISREATSRACSEGPLPLKRAGSRSPSGSLLTWRHSRSHSRSRGHRRRSRSNSRCSEHSGSFSRKRERRSRSRDRRDDRDATCHSQRRYSHSRERRRERAVPLYANTYSHAPGPPHCTYGLRAPASCVLHAPEAQGSLPRAATAVRTPYAYRPRACRTYRVIVPWHPRPPVGLITSVPWQPRRSPP